VASSDSWQPIRLNKQRAAIRRPFLNSTTIGFG